MNQRGMTLVELAIVVAMIGIAAAVAVPAYQKVLPRIRLKNAAGEVNDAMISARTRSITGKENYTLSFDLAADTYTTQPASGAAEGPLGEPWKGVDIYSDTSDAAVQPFSGNDVVFRPNGTADTAGYEAVYLRSSPDRGERFRVKVLGATGKTTIEEWAGGSWVSAF